MPKSKKKDLGKGLKALLASIDDSPSEIKEETVKEISKSIGEIPLSQIEVNPFQPRNEFEQDALEELAESIKTYGLVQPITIRRLAKDQYQLISGERRFRASKMAGLTAVPAYVRVVEDKELLELALVENIQRRDLNAIEIGISYQRLLDEFGYTHDQLADRLGKKRSTISNYIRLLKLPPQIQAGLKEGELSMGHARALINVDDISEQLHIYQRIISEKLSVRMVEKIVARSIEPLALEAIASAEDEVTRSLRKYESKLSSIMGSKVRIKASKKGNGNVEIKFSSMDELNRIIELLEEL